MWATVVVLLQGLVNMLVLGLQQGRRGYEVITPALFQALGPGFPSGLGSCPEQRSARKSGVTEYLGFDRA